MLSVKDILHTESYLVGDWVEGSDEPTAEELQDAELQSLIDDVTAEL